MTQQAILLQRLTNQQLTKPKFATPKELVAWFGCVQSQDYSGAKWALAQRLRNVTDEVLEEAFTNGDILRTHSIRPTWHFVAPEDIRWILKLTAPRIKRFMSYYNKELGLNDKIFAQTQEIFQKVLAGGKALTRSELGSFLEKEKLPSKGQAMGHIAMWAELDRVICSGPRHGKQFTYMLLKERAPQAKDMKRDEALAELTKRYFTSHGPATVKDFVWWSGLLTEDCKRGLEMNKPQLLHETIDGKEYWVAETQSFPMTSDMYLLPNYDEYAIAFKERDILIDPNQTEQLDSRGNAIFQHLIMYKGVIVGLWRRTLKKDTVIIESKFFTKPDKEMLTEFQKAADRFGEYLKLTVKLT